MSVILQEETLIQTLEFGGSNPIKKQINPVM